MYGDSHRRTAVLLRSTVWLSLYLMCLAAVGRADEGSETLTQALLDQGEIYFWTHPSGEYHKTHVFLRVVDPQSPTSDELFVLDLGDSARCESQNDDDGICYRPILCPRPEKDGRCAPLDQGRRLREDLASAASGKLRDLHTEFAERAAKGHSKKWIHLGHVLAARPRGADERTLHMNALRRFVLGETDGAPNDDNFSAIERRLDEWTTKLDSKGGADAAKKLRADWDLFKTQLALPQFELGWVSRVAVREFVDSDRDDVERIATVDGDAGVYQTYYRLVPGPEEPCLVALAREPKNGCLDDLAGVPRDRLGVVALRDCLRAIAYLLDEDGEQTRMRRKLLHVADALTEWQVQPSPDHENVPAPFIAPLIKGSCPQWADGLFGGEHNGCESWRWLDRIDWPWHWFGASGGDGREPDATEDRAGAGWLTCDPKSRICEGWYPESSGDPRVWWREFGKEIAARRPSGVRVRDDHRSCNWHIRREHDCIPPGFVLLPVLGFFIVYWLYSARDARVEAPGPGAGSGSGSAPGP